MKNTTYQKALYIRIDENVHHEVKILTAYKHISMEKWVLEAILEKLVKDKSCFLNNEIPK